VKRAQQLGMTLIELTVAMAIGLFLIGGALYVYSQSKNSYRAGDSLARLQESARFALDTIEPDIRLARYWGLNAEPARITVPAGTTVTCNGIAPDFDPLDLADVVRVRDDTYDLNCASFNDAPRAGSDVLILRHAEPWRAGIEPAPDPQRLQVQTTLAQSGIDAILRRGDPGVLGDCTAPTADPVVVVPDLGGRYATTTCYRGESITPGNSFPRIPTFNYEVASTGMTDQRDARVRLVQGYAITGASGR